MSQARRFPSVTGKFFVCHAADPATHYVLKGGEWQKVKSWKESPGHTSIDELAAVLVNPGYEDWHIVWVLDGRHWCLDLDGKNAQKIAEAICNPEDVERYAEMLREQHRNTADAAAAFTYVETSRSGNGQHIIFDQGDLNPSDFGIKDHFGCAELYTASHHRFIILTGWAIGELDTAELPEGMTAFLRERFPKGEVAPVELPTDAMDGSKPSRELVFDDPWFHTGEGQHKQRDDNGNPVVDCSELRFRMLRDLATDAYGMIDARDRVWEAASNSWFATTYTPANSSNPDRFTRTSKALGVKYKEISKALNWAAVKVAKVAEARALVGPMVEASIAKSARRETKAPTFHARTRRTFFETVCRATLRRSLAVADLSEVEHCLPFWEDHAMLTLMGMIAGMTVRPVGAGAYPSTFVLGETGTAKSLLSSLLKSLIPSHDWPPNLEVLGSVTGGAAIRNYATKENHVTLLIVSEGKEFVLKLSSNIGSISSDASLQTFLYDAIAGMAVGKQGHAKSGEKDETPGCDAAQFSFHAFVQPHVIDEARSTKGFSVKSFVLSGFFGRAIVGVAPPRNKFDPDLYCDDSQSGTIHGEFVRQVFVAAAKEINHRKSYYFRSNNRSAFKAWLYDGMASLGDADAASNRFGQLCSVYALHHMVAASITRQHYRLFKRHFDPRQGPLTKQVVSFSEPKAPVFIKVPDACDWQDPTTGRVSEHFEYAREVLRQHARALVSIMGHEVPEEQTALVEKIALLIAGKADGDTFNATDVMRQGGTGVSYTKGEVTAFIEEQKQGDSLIFKDGTRKDNVLVTPLLREWAAATLAKK